MPMPVTACNDRGKPVPSKSVPVQRKTHTSEAAVGKRSLLGGLETDDIILFAIIFLLLLDDCNDIFLLLALGFIFIS